jgi:hypothetical protein
MRRRISLQTTIREQLTREYRKVILRTVDVCQAQRAQVYQAAGEPIGPL